MSIVYQEIHPYLAIGALVISVLLTLNAIKTRKIAARSLFLAESAKKTVEINNLTTLPSIDLLEVLEVDGKYRVVLLLSNMRSNPFRINSLSVSKLVYKTTNIKNLILSMTENKFEWNYEPIDDYLWNPKRDLDDSEKYVSEAAQFLIVNESEKVLITIPEFSKYETYRFKVTTTHGIVTLTGSIAPSGKVFFCKSYNQTLT